MWFLLFYKINIRDFENVENFCFVFGFLWTNNFLPMTESKQEQPWKTPTFTIWLNTKQSTSSLKSGTTHFLFVSFRSFQTIYRIKSEDICGIQTRIIGVEVKLADHLNTTTAQNVVAT